MAIWHENIRNIQAELALLTDYAEYDFEFVSNNGAVRGNHYSFGDNV